MIRLIKGVVASTTQNGVVVLVSGIGYLVYTSKKLNLLPDDSITLHTYLAVRETALDLYGFVQEKELTLFELLLTIPKIGPKSAMQILDQADMTLIIESIKLQDPAHLSKLSGIGKKTAEKIVLELKDKVLLFDSFVDGVESNLSSAYTDAFDTLLTLGYNPVSIKHTLDTLPTDSTTSIFVKNALRLLN